MRFSLRAALFLAITLSASASDARKRPRRETPPAYDLLIRGGTIYDGSGGAAFVGDVAIKGDRIVYVGPPARAHARSVIDAHGLAVAPGFINMLSWAAETLIQDGRALSDVKQGVTLEVFGEGWSMGPWTEAFAAEAEREQASFRYPIEWRTLGGYLDFIERRGIGVNVASFVGASTVRVQELGRADIDPTLEQIARMRALVRGAMNDGAMGIGSALIYVPAVYAETAELAALAAESASCGGMYISHMRSEGGRILEAIDEVVEISRRSGSRAEIYHLKTVGESNWKLMDAAIARIEAARASGVPITANMYTYTASGTGLDSRVPLWAREGGLIAMRERLRQPALRARAVAEMKADPSYWSTVQPLRFKNPALRQYSGKRLPEIAAMRGQVPEEAVIDLLLDDESQIATVFHSISEENVRKVVALPWVSFGSDASAYAAEPPFSDAPVHPRAYGNFARVIGKYVREERRLSLAEAVRRLAALPAQNLRIADRGRLRQGYFADIAVFDPAKVADRATYDQPHQYALGMKHVLVNGTAVLKNGEPTGAKPGRAVRGPGWKTCPAVPAAGGIQ
jgi:N-acyl-D-amino-acid deacylase